MYLSHLHTYTAKEPNLAGEEFVFELKEGNEICFYASFKLDFSITYRGYPNISNKSIIHIMVGLVYINVYELRMWIV